MLLNQNIRLYLNLPGERDKANIYMRRKKFFLVAGSILHDLLKYVSNIGKPY